MLSGLQLGGLPLGFALRVLGIQKTVASRGFVRLVSGLISCHGQPVPCAPGLLLCFFIGELFLLLFKLLENLLVLGFYQLNFLLLAFNVLLKHLIVINIGNNYVDLFLVSAFHLVGFLLYRLHELFLCFDFSLELDITLLQVLDFHLALLLLLLSKLGFFAQRVHHRFR